MSLSTKKIYIFSLSALGQGLSGGDRIFIEFARNWSENIDTKVFVWEEGRDMCARQKLSGKRLEIKLVPLGVAKNLGFLFVYILRILLGLKLGLILKLDNKVTNIIYSSSEFWMDTLPCIILKLRYPKTIWVSAWYQTAPNPFRGFKEGNRNRSYRLHAFLYWFMQKPVYPLVKRVADYVLVNNENERKMFMQKDRQKRVYVLLGAVRTEDIAQWKKRNAKRSTKIYDAVFQGRFHPQKGVVELVDIWKLVVEQRPKSKLIMIGDGPLWNDVVERIKKYNLENEITLAGYVYDGDEKYRIFNSSLVVVHPAYYDSGGMAAAEAMSFNLPCVGFDLPAYESYYPNGMVKVPIGDIEAFADSIVKLLSQPLYYKRLAREAGETVNKYWSWIDRSEEVLRFVSKNE